MKFKNKIKLTITIFIIFSVAIVNPLLSYAGNNFDLPIYAEINGHDVKINSVAFSPDGKTLVSGDENCNIIIWDTSTGEEVKRISEDNNGNISKVVFSPDGKILATTHNYLIGESIIKLWDTKNWEQISELKGHGNSYIKDMTFNYSSNMLVSGGNNKKVIYWDVKKGIELKKISVNGFINHISCHPTQDIVSIGLDDSSVHIKDGNGGYIKSISKIQEREYSLSDLTFSPDGKYLVCASHDVKQPIILDVEDDYKEIKLLDSQYPKNVNMGWQKAVFTADGKFLATKDFYNIYLYRFPSGELIKNIEGYDLGEFSLDMTKLVLLEKYGKNIQLRDATQLPVKKLKDIRIGSTNINLNTNEKQKMIVFAQYSDGSEEIIPNDDLSWNSSDLNIAVVDNEGNINAKGAGSTIITVKYKGVEKSISVEVNSKEEFDLWETRYDVPIDKEWAINFEQELDRSTIKEKNIYVTDESGNILPMFYYQGEDNTIYISPVKDYKKGNKYTLWIKDFKSSNGDIIRKYIKMEFITVK